MSGMSKERSASGPVRIAWDHWQGMVEVRIWQALCLSLDIDPEGDDLDLHDLAQSHSEFKRRKLRLMHALSDSSQFSPCTLNMGDPLRGGVLLTEFAAWCFSTTPPFGNVPGALVNIGWPLINERAEQKRKAEGRYTLEEAAEQLAAAGESYSTMLAGLKKTAAMKAGARGSLPMHEPGREARISYGTGDGEVSRVREFFEHAYWSDLNQWLEENEPRITFRFPSPGCPPNIVAANANHARPEMEATPATTSEKPKARRKRLLEQIEEEERLRGEHGALARVFAREKLIRPTADRSNIGKDIKLAKKERADERRAGPFDGLRR